MRSKEYKIQKKFDGIQDILDHKNINIPKFIELIKEKGHDLFNSYDAAW